MLQTWWVGRTTSAALPLALFQPLYFFSTVAGLTAYRVLMVWVFDRTESLLVAILMHASLIIFSISGLILVPPAISGVPFLTLNLVFAAGLWVVVALVAVVNGGQLARQPLEQPR